MSSRPAFLEALWQRHYSSFVFACFFMFGLTNPFPFITMLSAAHDLLTEDQDQSSSSTTNSTYNDCNSISTGAILLADILPGFVLCSKLGWHQ